MSGNKLIINAALTGMVPTRADNPNVPLTPDEIAADARRCADAGASIIHLHAREPDGSASCRADLNQDILQKVRAACPDAILCVSTSGRVHKRFEDRAAVLDVTQPAPEMASLTLGSMNFARQESINAPEMIHALAQHMKQRGVKPELEIFEVGMAEYAGYLLNRGILQPPLYANILLGNLGTLGATSENLDLAIRALPPGTTWAAAGIGRYQLPANTMAIEKGGHVRVGLEDNLWMDADKTTPATNAALIERIVARAHAAGRAIASPREARTILNIPSSSPQFLNSLIP